MLLGIPHLALLAFSALIIGISSCSGTADSSIAEEDFIKEDPQPNVEVFMVLDTNWGTMHLEVVAQHFPDERQDEISIISDDTDTITLFIYQAESLLEPDLTPIIVFDSDSTFGSNFIIISDSVAVFSMRSNGLKRPELMLLSKDHENKLTLHDDPDAVLTGQILYAAFLPLDDLFLLHTSGFREDSMNGNFYRTVVSYQIQNKAFVLHDHYNVRSGEEELFLDGDYESNRLYYKMIYAEYLND